MYYKFFLLFLFSLNTQSNIQIEDINNFLKSDRFSYEQVSMDSNEIISGKLILNTLQIYLEINDPYKESYLIDKNFITYNDIDFSQQRTFEYSKDDFPLINIISKKKISIEDDLFNIITLKDSIYLTDKLTKQIFKISFIDNKTLVIEFKDNLGVSNSIYLNRLS